MTRPIFLPLSILILGTASFVFFVPIVPVSQSCRNPGCGGPEYESLGYALIGVGETLSFVSPNTPYGLVALVASVIFPISIACGIVIVSRELRGKKEPTNPKRGQ